MSRMNEVMMGCSASPKAVLFMIPDTGRLVTTILNNFKVISEFGNDAKREIHQNSFHCPLNSKVTILGNEKQLEPLEVRPSTHA